MRALIGPDLLRTPPRKPGDVRDTKLTGFVLRVRRSGTHSYLVNLGRGRWMTLGTVETLSPEKARLAASAALANVERDTLRQLAEDPTLNLRDARAKARGAIKQGTKKRITWKVYLDEHYEPWSRAHHKHGAELIARLRVNFADWNDTRLADISSFAIERWRTHRLKTRIGSRTVKPATVNKDLSGLRGALSRAREWKLIKDHPMTDVKTLKADPGGKVRYLSPEEAARLSDALAARDTARREARDRANDWRRARGYALLPTWPADSYTDHLTPLVALALHTGCRRGELLALTWGDIDLAGAYLSVKAEDAKSGVSRIIPLNATILDVLRRWKQDGARREDYVFADDDGRAIDDPKKSWAGILKAATITGFRFHDLRHTFASRLVQAGVDLNTVRELLGHADIKMTLRYAHLAPEHKAAAVAKLVSA